MRPPSAVVLAIACLFSAAQNISAQSPGPVAAWGLEEPSGPSALDTTGNGNDGTIGGRPAYFPYPGEKAMVILDGATGAVTARVPLEGNPNREPVTIGPIVGGDGFGYVLVTTGMRLTLHRLSRTGQVATEVIVDGTCTSYCTDSARALSYESPRLPTDGDAGLGEPFGVAHRQALRPAIPVDRYRLVRRAFVRFVPSWQDVGPFRPTEV